MMDYLPEIALGVYVLALVFATRLASRSIRPQEYVIGGRNVGPFATMASIAGNLRDGAGLAAWVTLSYFYGFGALWLTFGLMAGVLVMGWFAPRVRELAKKRDYFSVTQLLADRFGSGTARVASIVITVTAFLYAAAQVYVVGRLLATLINLPPSLGMWLTALIVAGYLAFGGYKTTIFTGIIQWILLLAILLVPWLILGIDTTQVIDFSGLATIDGFSAVAFFGLSFFVTISAADLWQLLFSARSRSAARSGFVWTAPVYLLISGGVVMFGLSLKETLSDSVAAGDALFALFEPGVMPELAVALVGVFAVAAVMSTLDSQTFLLTSTVVRQVAPENLGSNDFQIERYVKFSNLGLLLVLALIATMIGDLVQFLFSAVTLGTTLSGVLLVSVIFKRNKSLSDGLGMMSLLVGVAVYIPLFILGAFDNLIFTLVPPLVSIGFLLIALPWLVHRSR